MQKKSILRLGLFFCFFQVGLFVACQPTPEKDFVINKGESTIEEIINIEPVLTEQQEIACQDPLDVIDYWSESFSVNGTDILIEASVEWPVAQYPVYEVNLVCFSPDKINDLISFFLPEATTARETGYSEQEIKENLEAAVRGYWYVDGDKGYYGPYDGQEEEITYWQEELLKIQEDTTTDTFEPIVTLPATKTYTDVDGKEISVFAYDDSWGISVSLGQLPVIQPESLVLNGSAIKNEPQGQTIEGILIDKDDAIALAENFLSDIEYNGFQVAGVEKARVVHGITERVLTTGWQVRFCRNDGDYASVDYANLMPSLSHNVDYATYAKPWFPERLWVFVDESGIRFAEHAYPLRTLKEINNNVGILNFHEIQDLVRNRFKYEFVWGENISSVNVDRIALVGALSRVPNNIDVGRIMPAWLCEFTVTDEVFEDNTRYCLAINAIDGSDINILNP